MWSPVVLFSLLVINGCSGLDNGLAITPPMGWLTWERFRCNTNCQKDPDNCISENLMKAQAKEMVKQGFLAAGYEYIIVDDCWLDHQRDPETGKLQPDPDRFPSGMKALGDYIHGLGLKYGIYEDYGNKTCGGYPGVLGHLTLDAQTLADWGADYVKLDGCHVDTKKMDEGYPEFGMALNKTGRPIAYSCSWPAYQHDPDYKSIAEHCNLWRNWHDIQDNWNSVLSIIDWFGDQQDELVQHAGTGHWNDPDMLIIGNFGLNYDQARTQMALWAIMSAPLIMSNDLRTIKQEFKDILLNRNVITINQDSLAIQGKRVQRKKDIDIFVRSIMPTYNGNMSAAVAIMNRAVNGTPTEVKFTPSSLGLTHPAGYTVKEVFNNTVLASVLPDTEVNIMVNCTGVQLLRMDVKSQYKPQYADANSKSYDSSDDNAIQANDMGLIGWSDETFHAKGFF